MKSLTLHQLLKLAENTQNIYLLRIIRREIAERVNEIEIKWEDQKIPNWSSKGQFTK
jgi:hypothetical protein